MPASKKSKLALTSSFDIASLIPSFVSSNSEIGDIVTFAEADWGFRLKLTLVQKFILRCLFGLPLDKDVQIPIWDMTKERLLCHMNEPQLLDWMFERGFVNTNQTEGKTFRNFILAVGRRAGKSFLSGAIIAYQIIKMLKEHDPGEPFGLPPQKIISATISSPSPEQAREIKNFVYGFLANSPQASSRLRNDTLQSFSIMTDKDLEGQDDGSQRKIPSMRVIGDGCSSNTLRGGDSFIVALDEMAFYKDLNNSFSADAVYKALEPQLSAFGRFGKLLMLSSPGTKAGAFYQHWKASFNDTDRTFAFNTYSVLVNPDKFVSENLKAEQKRSPRSFRNEYGGEFTASEYAWIENEDDLARQIRDTPSEKCGKAGINYYYGIDLGFSNDGTAKAVAHKDYSSGKIVVDYVNLCFSATSDVWKSGLKEYREYSQELYKDEITVQMVLDDVETLHKLFPAKGGIFDQHNGVAFAELLKQKNLPQFKMHQFSDSETSKAYDTFYQLMLADQLSLPKHCCLYEEMIELQAIPVANSVFKRIRVDHLAEPGYHNDLSWAIVEAVVLCVEEESKHPSSYGGSAVASTGQASQGMARHQTRHVMGGNGMGGRMLRMHGGLGSGRPFGF